MNAYWHLCRACSPFSWASGLGKTCLNLFAALFEESLQRANMRAGEVITAEVVRIEHNHVVVNAGLKSEAYVPIANSRTTRANSKSNVGDFVSVAIDSVETATATPC